MIRFNFLNLFSSIVGGFMGRCRWAFEVDFQGIQLPEQFCKVSCRPNIESEGVPQEFTTTFYDLQGEDILTTGLWNIMMKVSDGKKVMPYNKEIAGTGKLKMWVSGNCLGIPQAPYALEEWTLEGLWPISINYGELDMGDQDLSIDVKWQYDKAFWKSLVPSSSIGPVVVTDQKAKDNH
jgi:hypothetical protein